jgi:ABC-type sugar transport system ATPase subunit
MASAGEIRLAGQRVNHLAARDRNVAMSFPVLRALIRA